MIIQTSSGDFLIEESENNSGSLLVYSGELEEIQRLFGSSEIELTARPMWKYRVSICKQTLANVLLLLVKEVTYTDFSREKLQLA